MAPCACRQARYASRCVAEADLEEDAGLQQRGAAFGATIERLNGLVLAEFPSSTSSARLALGLLLSPKFPPGVRAAVWRVCGLAGTAAHLRVDVDACACSAEDA